MTQKHSPLSCFRLHRFDCKLQNREMLFRAFVFKGFVTVTLWLLLSNEHAAKINSIYISH